MISTSFKRRHLFPHWYPRPLFAGGGVSVSRRVSMKPSSMALHLIGRVHQPTNENINDYNNASQHKYTYLFQTQPFHLGDSDVDIEETENQHAEEDK